MKHTPGPWHACGNGKCDCKQVWSSDYPVAQVECGKWGDDYASIRLTGESLQLKAEPFMDQITYGEISEDVAEANSLLIASAPDLLEACKGALAALTQNKTYPSDIEAAKEFLTRAISKAEEGHP
jgi:hypothetical protein